MRILRLVLPFVLGLLVMFSQAADSVPSIDAINQAEQYLRQGNPLAAYQETVKLLEEAKQLHNASVITQALITQGRAYQALGQPLNACHTLTQALKLEDTLCQTRNTVTSLSLHPLDDQSLIGVQALSTTLQQLGQLDTARALLTQAINQSHSPIFELGLANLDRALFVRYRNRYQAMAQPEGQIPALLSANNFATLALDRYHQLIQGTYPDTINFSAKLNWLLLYTDLSQWVRSEQSGKIPELIKLQSEASPLLKAYSKSLLDADLSILPAIDQVYAQLKIAHSFLDLGLYEAESGQLIQSALKQATQLNNPRAQSLAQGTLAEFYLKQHRQADATQAFEHARSLALSLRAADLTYKWNWQLGRLYRNQNPATAISFYADALQAQESVRANLFPANQEVQVAFAEEIEPLYREYLSLLLAQPKPDLEKALDVHERLQVATLQTFLQCGRLNLVSLRDVQASTKATVLHIYDLGDRITEIIRTPDGRLHQFFPNSDQVRKSADHLISTLQDPRFFVIQPRSYLPDAQVLYQELIVPAQKTSVLPKQGTLVVVTDDFLQNLPLGLLHDGQGYLVEHYSIATLFAGQVRQPKPLPYKQLKTLVGGISQQSPSLKDFPSLSELPEVETEVEEIRRYTRLEHELLNKDFTWTELLNSLNHSQAPIIHLSTHGQFASDPRQTILFAWDKPIPVQDIEQLFQQRLTSGQSPPELLFLSACQTAQGDKRSIFGIAGIAIKSGSASVVASLWQIDSEATVALIRQFYQSLYAGQSRAEALQTAQLSLLHTPKYSHPYYWSGFTLLGDWL